MVLCNKCMFSFGRYHSGLPSNRCDSLWKWSSGLFDCWNLNAWWRSSNWFRSDVFPACKHFRWNGKRFGTKFGIWFMYPHTWLGRAWASPTLAWLLCKTHVYVCLSVCLSVCVWPYTENFNWTNGNEGNVHFKFAHVLKRSVRWIATEDSSPCKSTPVNLLSVRDRLRLEQDCSAGTKENRKEGDQSGLR